MIIVLDNYDNVMYDNNVIINHTMRHNVSHKGEPLRSIKNENINEKNS